jgi:hypothetical protein
MGNFMYFIAGFFAGATIVDFLWARKFGVTELVWYKIKRIFSKIFK